MSDIISREAARLIALEYISDSMERHGALEAIRALPAVQPVTGDPVTLTYTNWRGETAQRTIVPKRVWFGTTDWHPKPQWLLTALDTEKGADRDFALKDFGNSAVQRKVKPLVWDKPLGGFHIAKLPFGGEIRIMWDLHPADGERYILHPLSLGRRVFRTLDTAKAAAQDDYDACIRSALEPADWPVTAPSMTDLMVDPDSLDAFMEANPLPAVQPDAQCCMCGKKGLSTKEDGGPECELHDGRWVCSENCWNDALEPSAGAIREAALREAWGVAADETDRLRATKNNHAHKLDAKGEAMAEGAFLVVVALADLFDNPGKEVMPDASSDRSSDTAPAGLSAGGGADYDAVREAIETMVRRKDEYGIGRWSADRALVILRSFEARNCPAPRVLVEDGKPVLTWVIGGWKLYQYCDEEETQAFRWQGPHATEGGA